MENNNDYPKDMSGGYTKSPAEVSNVEAALKKHDSGIRQSTYLRNKSPYWPEIYSEMNNKFLCLSTYVRIYRDGKWYKVFCLESGVFEDISYEPIILVQLFSRLIQSVHNIQHLYKPGNFLDAHGDPIDEIDTSQESETERLFKKMTGN
jgi:hypothetical protein